MKCVRCGSELKIINNSCAVCGCAYMPVCSCCISIAPDFNTPCSSCGGEVIPVWNPSVGELQGLGIHCFMPYKDDRVYDIFLGGNRDGGGYVFHNTAGYTGPSHETLVLPSMVEGQFITGIWNEFFCIGDDFAPEAYDATFERMYPIKKIVVSEGIREAGIYAFFGCSGLKTLVLPRSMKKMMYDFADLFNYGLDFYPNGRIRGQVDVCYNGSETDWEGVSVTNLFIDYVNKGYVNLKFDKKE